MADEQDFLEADGGCSPVKRRSSGRPRRIANLPPMQGVEIAFAGRSNVGKSSLINALTGRKTLARTSNTPGRTQELNFFRVGDGSRLVDMPGYGFAAVGKQKVAAWTGLIHDYLRGRASLARVFLLIDARHGIKAPIRRCSTRSIKAAVSYQVVLTKPTRSGRNSLRRGSPRRRPALKKHPAAFPR
jgi:GTP-binding protein